MLGVIIGYRGIKKEDLATALSGIALLWIAFAMGTRLWQIAFPEGVC